MFLSNQALNHMLAKLAGEAPSREVTFPTLNLTVRFDLSFIRRGTQLAEARLRSTLTDAIDFVGHLQTFDDMNAAWSAFLGFAANFGFTRGALADMPGPGERVQDTVVCLSWPEAWIKRYIEKDYIRNDPARLHLS